MLAVPDRTKWVAIPGGHGKPGWMVCPGYVSEEMGVDGSAGPPRSQSLLKRHVSREVRPIAGESRPRTRPGVSDGVRRSCSRRGGLSTELTAEPVAGVSKTVIR